MTLSDVVPLIPWFLMGCVTSVMYQKILRLERRDADLLGHLLRISQRNTELLGTLREIISKIPVDKL